MKYRPNTTIMYFYGVDCKACITCYPQSRWKLLWGDESKVELGNKNISIELKREDFEKQWQKVESEDKQNVKYS